MKITGFQIDNFKSLVSFELPIAKLTCLIGLNGAGKSTVIQAVDFASRMFMGRVDYWLSDRGWKEADLNSKLVRKSNIDMVVEAKDGKTEYLWSGSFNRILLRCTRESLRIDGRERFSVADAAIATANRRAPARGEIAFRYQGSVLSALTDDALPDKEIQQFRSFMRGITSLDLLSPQSLKRRTDVSDGKLGLGGERLSAFLYELPYSDKSKLLKLLVDCYPHLDRIVTRSLRRGWKELSIREQFGNRGVYTEASHINDGMLRLMAILGETFTDSTFLLFDEIENGINPELVEFLLDTLIDASQQVLVTTHSPMILNFLDDDVAREGVQYLYRDVNGATKTVPFFSIPSVEEKLEVMGPGEAFVDTDLAHLAGEIAEMSAPNQE
jgi:predicted ATPase